MNTIDTQTAILDDQIDAVLDSFNFENVRRVIEALGIMWQDENGEPVVPEVSDLRETANELLSSVAYNALNEKTTLRDDLGNFVAIAEYDQENNLLVMELNYVVDTVSNELYVNEVDDTEENDIVENEEVDDDFDYIEDYDEELTDVILTYQNLDDTVDNNEIYANT